MPRVRGRGHRLLAHLALVHVPRRLVEVRQGDRAGEVAQEARLPDLLVGGRRVGLVAGDAHVHVNLEQEAKHKKSQNERLIFLLLMECVVRLHLQMNVHVNCTCSKVPISSMSFMARFTTGLIILDGPVKMNRPGNCPAFALGGNSTYSKKSPKEIAQKLH